MAVNSNLEKIFFNWILKNPEFFKLVPGNYFDNTDIKFIYDCIRNEFLASTDKVVPKPKEILNLVKIYDKNESITNDFIKALLKIDWNEFRNEFVEPRFKSWVLSNSSINGLINSFELINNIDKTDYNKVQEIVSSIRTEMDSSINIQLDKGNIGLDFDDPQSHDQEAEVNKITSGYPCFDGITDGGFDRKTLSVLMGGPGSGKCTLGSTIIKIRNKYTGDIMELDMEFFYSITKKKAGQPNKTC